MKTFLIVFTVLCSLNHQALAKAYFQTKQEMIQRSDAIAIITITDVQECDTTGKIWTYKSQGAATVQRLLIGELPSDFTFYGAENFICASCPITEGRFIAFLQQDGDWWTGSNWQLSLRPIEDGMVEWYVTDENRYEMKPTALDTVLAEILSKVETDEVSISIGNEHTMSGGDSE